MNNFIRDVERYHELTGCARKVGVGYAVIQAFNPRLMPVAIFRISSWCFRHGLFLFSRIFTLLNMILFGLEITARAEIGGGFFMPHTQGIVVGADKIGKNVTIYQGVTLGSKFLDMRFTQSARPVIGDNVVIGSGAKVLGGITVGSNVKISANAVVVENLADGSRVGPDPVRIHRDSWVDGLEPGPRIINFKEFGDHRGSLLALEGARDVPFDIQRVYYIYGNTGDVRRGFHAHRTLRQVAVAVSGSCKMLIDDGTTKKVFDLNSPAQGLLIEGLLWREIFDFSPDCVLVVLADQIFHEGDYIRNYEEFKKSVGKRSL